MELTEFLQRTGMSPERAAAVANAYRNYDPSEFRSFLQESGLDPEWITSTIQQWAEKHQPQPWRAETIVEPIGARSWCVYRVVGPDQAYGRCWAAMRLPLHFPGAMDQQASPSTYAVVAAEQDPDTKLFKWVTLTPNMKATFGYVLEQAGYEVNRWAIVREFDLLRDEQPGQGEPEQPEQPA